VFAIEIDEPHHCTETGDGTHGEEEADSNLLRQAPLHHAQNSRTAFAKPLEKRSVGPSIAVANKDHAL